MRQVKVSKTGWAVSVCSDAEAKDLNEYMCGVDMSIVCSNC
jgi:hypothetical protein